MSDEINEGETELEAAPARVSWKEKARTLVRHKFWTSGKFTSLLAFMISIGTFFTFAYQTYLIRQQQSANVLPYLRIDYGYGTDYFQIQISNNGVGPAIIQDFVVHYRDSTYRSGLNRFAATFAKLDTSTTYSVSSSYLAEGFVISNKETVEVLASNNRETANMLKALFFDEEVRLEIVYSSVFDEKWRLTNGSFIPQRID